jgi:pilus assembly protein CpaB
VKRIAGILVGLVIAGIGTAILMGYVNQARQAAVAEEAMVPVYVVSTVIPRSTPVADVQRQVVLTEVPARLVSPGAVTDLTQLDQSLVTGADLLAGEQLVAARFTDPRLVTRVQVPDGLQEVTISLDAQRALGGSLVVGDTVGVFASFAAETDTATGTATPAITDVVLHRVLVTGVQFGMADVVAVQENMSGDDTTVTRAPNGQVLVTLAVDTAAASKIVFSAEFGSVWLTLEGPRATPGETPMVDKTNIFGGAA